MAAPRPRPTAATPETGATAPNPYVGNADTPQTEETKVSSSEETTETTTSPVSSEETKPSDTVDPPLPLTIETPTAKSIKISAPEIHPELKKLFASSNDVLLSYHPETGNLTVYQPTSVVGVPVMTIEKKHQDHFPGNIWDAILNGLNSLFN